VFGFKFKGRSLCRWGEGARSHNIRSGFLTVGVCRAEERGPGDKWHHVEATEPCVPSVYQHLAIMAKMHLLCRVVVRYAHRGCSHKLRGVAVRLKAHVCVCTNLYKWVGPSLCFRCSYKTQNDCCNEYVYGKRGRRNIVSAATSVATLFASLSGSLRITVAADCVSSTQGLNLNFGPKSHPRIVDRQIVSHLTALSKTYLRFFFIKTENTT
jgi:hypothetical protein